MPEAITGQGEFTVVPTATKHPPLETLLRSDDVVTARVPWKGHMLVVRRKRLLWNVEAQLISDMTDPATGRYSIARFYLEALQKSFLDAQAYPDAAYTHVDFGEPGCRDEQQNLICKNAKHFSWTWSPGVVSWAFAPANLFGHDPELVHLLYEALGFREMAQRFENPAQLLEREVTRQKNG